MTRHGATGLLCACLVASHAPALAGADAQARPLDDEPALVDGRLPAPDLLIALTALPTDDATRRAVLAALQREVNDLPDGRVRLGWSGSDAREPARPLDAARREAFAAFLDRMRQAPASAGIGPAAGPRPLATEPTGLACRQAHLLLLGATLEPGTSRGAPVVHRLPLRDDVDWRQRIGLAFQTVLAESRRLPGTRTTALRAVPSATNGASLIVAAQYDALHWSGALVARVLDGGSVDPTSAPWGRQADTGMAHSTASLLGQIDPGARVVVSSQAGPAGLRGIPWRWPFLTAAQREALNGGTAEPADIQGTQRLAWLRGVRTDEQAHGGPLRDRASVQADAIQATPWVDADDLAGDAARPAILYAGGNGGMLHAFDARDGRERFAYVPQGLYGRLADLAQPPYTHRSFVDATPFSARWTDRQLPQHWVFGFLGAGGKGYFALDVLDLNAFRNEESAAQQVRLDTTASADVDLGHIYGEPVTAPGNPARSASVARLHDGRAALVLGNGFGSEAQRASLLIQYLDGPRELRKIAAGIPGNGNGLAPVRLVDADGDQVVDFAYAGDLLGSLWKFDLRSTDPNAWTVALAGVPLLRARDAQGRAQPITVAPAWWPDPQGGRVLVLGTGQLLGRADRADLQTQTIYGVLDRDDGGRIANARNDLLRRTLREATAPAAQDAPAPTAGPARGWFIDLPVPGERVLVHPAPYDGSLIDITSVVPSAPPGPGAAESCTPARERIFRNTVRALDGQPPRLNLYGDPAATALGINRLELSPEPRMVLRTMERERLLDFDGAESGERNRLGFIAVRPAWRQLQ